MKLCSLVKYVIHERVEDHLRCGWMGLGQMPGHHGQWAVLMEWPCQCPVVEPAR